jgi:ABC-2 type transport system ATP-binding protein
MQRLCLPPARCSNRTAPVVHSRSRRIRVGGRWPGRFRGVEVTATGLSKRFGSVVAVDDVSFTLQPGVVTGFLGPNGAGKSTTLRLMLGLDRGAGSTLFGGRPLAAHPHPSSVVGAHMDAKFFHPRRTARNHLRMLAAEARIPDSRVDEVLDLVGLHDVATKRPAGFSLGMGQRLGLAGAVLARPSVLLLDEPANGLDPQSIQWLREFLRHYASAGNTVLVSSHLLSEMQLLADQVVVIARGRLVADESMATFVARSTSTSVLVRTPSRDRLATTLSASGVTFGLEGVDGISVTGSGTDRIGELAFAAGIPILELSRRAGSLEQAFLELTTADQQFAMHADDERSES